MSEPDPIPYISYSQANTYLDCPRSWYLGKVAKAEELPTWFLPVGTSVHQMIEDYVQARPVGRADEYFYPLVEAQLAVEPDHTKWLAGGGDGARVAEGLALEQVKACFDAAVTYLADVEVQGVEADISGELPGLDVPVRAYVDILGVHKKHGPIILDWKTGRTKPKGRFQLETYRALTMVQGMDYPTGHYVMLNPTAGKTRTADLSNVDPEAIGAKYQDVVDRMRQRLYPTDPGFKCRFCFQQLNCLLQAGPTARAKFYDRSASEGMPF